MGCTLNRRQRVFEWLDYSGGPAIVDFSQLKHGWTYP